MIRPRALEVGAALLAAVALLTACPKGDPNDAQLMPKPPPPPVASIPHDLRIPVEIDGKPGPPIQADTLSARKPDFQDQDHRAWLIAPLLGASASREDARITIAGEKDFEITMPSASKDGDLVAVLMLSRRGEMTAALVSPSDPFPPFHGRGRRLNRGGDPLPRVSKSIARIVVTYGATPTQARAEERPQVGEVRPLRVIAGGKELEPWTVEKLGTVARKGLVSGDAARESWSLRDLVRALVGPDARLVAVAGAGHRRLQIDPKAWADPQKTPTLRVNRQGLFKFQWVGDRNVLPAEAELRNVRVIEVE